LFNKVVNFFVRQCSHLKRWIISGVASWKCCGATYYLERLSSAPKFVCGMESLLALVKSLVINNKEIYS
jgi:hypothetical protein